jgi:NitT/TauT family transport system substrate-binding protein
MTISLLENFRALFYTPYYASIEIGSYKNAGVDVILVEDSTPGNGIDAIARGEPVLTWGGPMRVLKDHSENPKSDLICFCEVVGKDPFHILGHEPKPDFTMQDLTKVKLATFSEAATPWNCLQEDLRRADIDPASVDRVTDGAAADNIEAFMSGSIDAIQILEPYTEQLLTSGKAHLWYEGASRGVCSYTTFYTSRAFVNDHELEMLAMTSAMAETLKWVYAEDALTVAKTIAKYFPDEDVTLLARSLKRYQAAEIWNKTSAFHQQGLERLRAGLLTNKFIERNVPYSEIIDSRFDT